MRNTTTQCRDYGKTALAIAIAAAAMLAGCSNHPRWNPDEAGRGKTVATPLVIKTYFSASNCPEDVDLADPELIAGSARTVQWHAYRRSGSGETFDPEIEFAVYFEPFTGGRPIVSKRGVATSSPVNKNTPRKFPGKADVVYKYTVLGQGSTCEPVPFDPRLRVMN